MYRLPLLLLLFFGLSRCLIFAQESGIKPASISTIWYSNKTIHLQPKQGQLQPYQLQRGNNWVFQYTYKAADIVEIADDEFSETIVLAIKPTKLKKINQKISATKNTVIYLKSCFCRDAGPVSVLKGKIKGYQLDEQTWHLEITLKMPTVNQIQPAQKFKKIKGDFKLQVQ